MKLLRLPSKLPIGLGTATTQPKSSKHHDEYLAVCMIVRNQNQDLPEWFQHHYYNMGIRRFYILDDGSQPPTSDFADTFEDSQGCAHLHLLRQGARDPSQPAGHAAVHIQRLRGQPRREQHVAGLHRRRRILRHAGWGTARRGAPRDGAAPAHRLSRGELESALVQRAAYAAKSVRKAYTTCVDNDPENNGANSYNRYVKSIVRTKFYEGVANPHSFRTGNGSVFVGEFGDPVNPEAYRQPVTHDRLALHHYMVKSREEFEEKMNRSTGMSDARNWEFWDSVENAPLHSCNEMLRWVEDEPDEKE